MKLCRIVHKILKGGGGYHELVTNVIYAAVSLTTVRRVRYLLLSERLGTFPLVTSRIWREGRAVTTYPSS